MRNAKGQFVKGNKAWHKGIKGLMLNTGKTHFKKGHIPWHKGKHGLMPIPWNKEKKLPQFSNENSPHWIGDDIGKIGVHAWIKSKYGKADRCENPNCIYPRKDGRGKIMLKPKRYDWANKNHLYKRIRSDWQMLCVSCHYKYDRRLIIL